MAKAQVPQRVGFRERLRQITAVFKFTAEQDKLFIPLVVVAALVPIVLAVFATIFWGPLWIPVGLLLTLLAILIVLNLRANRAMLRVAAKQPGAAASIIENMRGDWRVTPAVASTTQMDMVHLVIGRPGVILVAEGLPARTRPLIAQERRRLSKVIGTADLRDLSVGEGPGEVPLKKLKVTLMKLPRTLTGKDINALDKRLTALTARPQLPKGAIPKNMRPPKGAFKAMRGGPR